jgi:hypothetical protein
MLGALLATRGLGFGLGLPTSHTAGIILPSPSMRPWGNLVRISSCGDRVGKVGFLPEVGNTVGNDFARERKRA